jgi:hypothetical protein
MYKIAIDRRFIWRTVLLILLITLVVVAFANRNAEQDIAMSTVLATNPQADMKYVYDVCQTSERADYQKKLLQLDSNASNAFLVEGSNDRDAFVASLRILFGPLPADTPAAVNRADARQGGCWFVAYLGSGPSEPRWFTIENAVVETGKIRLNYHRAHATMMTRDIQHYCYWVPLTKLDPGVYYVELYDTNLKAVTLSRRIGVEQEKRP